VHDVLVALDLLDALDALAVLLIVGVVGRVDERLQQVPLSNLGVEDVRHLYPAWIGQQRARRHHERAVPDTLLNTGTAVPVQFRVLFSCGVGERVVVVDLGHLRRWPLRVVEVEGDLDGSDPVLEFEWLPAKDRGEGRQPLLAVEEQLVRPEYALPLVDSEVAGWGILARFPDEDGAGGVAPVQGIEEITDPGRGPHVPALKLRKP